MGFVGCGGSVIFGGSLGAVGRCVGAAADGAPLVGGVVIAVEADASVVAVVTADSSARPASGRRPGFPAGRHRGGGGNGACRPLRRTEIGRAHQSGAFLPGGGPSPPGAAQRQERHSAGEGGYPDPGLAPVSRSIQDFGSSFCDKRFRQYTTFPFPLQVLAAEEPLKHR